MALNSYLYILLVCLGFSSIFMLVTTPFCAESFFYLLALVLSASIALSTQGDRIVGVVGPVHKWLGPVFEKTGYPITFFVFRLLGYNRSTGGEAIGKLVELKTGKAFILGINSGSHNSGVAVVEISNNQTAELIANIEEERYSAQKHDSSFPVQSLEAAQKLLENRGFKSSDILAICFSWDHALAVSNLISTSLKDFPFALSLFLPWRSSPVSHMFNVMSIASAPHEVDKWLKQWNQKSGLHSKFINPGKYSYAHHDCHAAGTFYLSPFSKQREKVILEKLDSLVPYGRPPLKITVCSTIWDETSGTNRIELLYRNESTVDSLGWLYGFISSTQGGWNQLSSEGRYMGAAAYGNKNRQTNPYYHRLKQILFFDSCGKIHINRAFAHWMFDVNDPYTKELCDILGNPLSQNEMWNPDHVLKVDSIKHAPITQERVDKAAALQMVFEDAMCHIVRHFISITQGSSYLIWTGGSALNCTTSQKLLDEFNEPFYGMYYSKPEDQLKLWVPPFPSDSGVAVGAALLSLLPPIIKNNTIDTKASMQFKIPLTIQTVPLGSAFLIPFAPRAPQYTSDSSSSQIVGWCLGKISNENLPYLADLMAYLIVNCDCIVGLMQGWAETGPRALGHRSIFASPFKSDTLHRINSKVKYRERIRPLAPCCTLSAAQKYFELHKGSQEYDYTNYDFMVLSCKAKEEATDILPAVVHIDGSSRIQVVRREKDPVTFEFLQCMGIRGGAEVAVNTSLNVGTPIVQTTEQAVQCLAKTIAMEALFIITEDNEIHVLSTLRQRITTDKENQNLDLTCASYIIECTNRWGDGASFASAITLKNMKRVECNVQPL